MDGHSSPQSRRALAGVALLTFVCGFTAVSGTAGGAGPQVPARLAAEQALTQRLTGEFTPPAVSGVERVTFLAGADTVVHRGAATRVRVPAIGIDAEVRSVGLVFREGRLQYDTPSVGAGHYAGSADPGAVGNVVIGGHVALRGGTGVFRTLPSVAVGAMVEVLSGGQTYRYEVTEVRLVAPDATEVMEPTQDATLTLITCSNDNARAKRIVVVGKLV